MFQSQALAAYVGAYGNRRRFPRRVRRPACRHYHHHPRAQGLLRSTGGPRRSIGNVRSLYPRTCCPLARLSRIFRYSLKPFILHQLTPGHRSNPPPPPPLNLFSLPLTLEQFRVSHLLLYRDRTKRNTIRAICLFICLLSPLIVQHFSLSIKLLKGWTAYRIALVPTTMYDEKFDWETNVRIKRRFFWMTIAG